MVNFVTIYSKSVNLLGERGITCLFRMKRYYRLGEGLGKNANVKEEIMDIIMLDAMKYLFGAIGVEKVMVLGKPTI